MAVKYSSKLVRQKKIYIDLRGEKTYSWRSSGYRKPQVHSRCQGRWTPEQFVRIHMGIPFDGDFPVKVKDIWIIARVAYILSPDPRRLAPGDTSV